MPRLAALRAKLLLGTDFPNIPYPFAHQIEALDRLGLGPEWLTGRVLGQRAGAHRLIPGVSAQPTLRSGTTDSVVSAAAVSDGWKWFSSSSNGSPKIQ